ncbi:MAG: isocitrate lyase/phosphoenolpyruvate mutase family protein [Polyangiaceae bacterium]|nr:isocitrate lyase/phosphoenolpyruvate mutase family protein [Polyangiaceae bacterium]
MENAAIFRELHRGPGVLRLANCWDAGSARVIENLGASALATTSAGLAWAAGYPDGDALPMDALLSSVRAIVRAIRVPLTVDMEGGYSDDPAAVGEAVAAVVGLGAVGINIEDGGSPPDLLVAKITQAKRAVARAGADVFINARTDVFLRGLVPEPARVAETLSRAARYREAGADGLFVPGLVDSGAIREIAGAAGLPLNVLARPGLPAAAELEALGVRRLSAGSSISQALYRKMADLASAFLKEGRSEVFFEVTTYGELNALFSKR